MLSGIATGLSWLAYFRAPQLGPASGVAPIDKLSLRLTIVVLKERATGQLLVGVALLAAGAIVAALT